MTLSFWLSDACLIAVQSTLVALPRGRVPGGIERIARRLTGRGWALVPLASILAVVLAIRTAGATADGLVWLALLAVPPLATAALAFAVNGARPALAALVVPLFALAWADRGGLAGEGAAVLLSALSCVALGVLLVAVAPHGWLKVGIVLMALVDAVLVGTELLQPATNLLNVAAPPARLPQLQRALFGDALIGYGDLFIAAVFGALLAAEAFPRRRAAALLTFALAACFDLLFLVLHVLPATVPVAVALLMTEAWRRRGGRRTP